MKLRIVAVVALLLVGGGAVAVALGVVPGSPATATQYLTSTAAVGDVADEVAATGTVASAATWSLAFGSEPARTSSGATAGDGAAGSTVAWPVIAVNAAVGDGVAAGDVLATADTAAIDAEIAAATRQLRIAEIELKTATENLDDASGTDQYRQARIALYNATSQHESAAANLADLVAQRALAVITAPAAGIVTVVNVIAGEEAPSGAAFELAESSLRVTTSVVESDLASVAVGQPAVVTVDAVGATVDGVVTAIAPVASTAGSGSVASFDVTVALTDPPAAVRIGMSADVSITIASATDVLTVPSTALEGSDGAYTVRVMGDTGDIEVRDVTVGLVTESAAEVTGGLQAGEEVVTGTVSDALSTTTGNSGGIRGLGGGDIPGGGFPGGGPGGRGGQ